jgi:hypothetical protein
MNVFNNQFDNDLSSICDNHHYISAGRHINKNCLSFNGIDLPVVSNQPDDINNCVGKRSASIRCRTKSVSLEYDLPMTAKMEDFSGTVSLDSTVTEVKSDVSSDFSSNALYQKAKAISPVSSRTNDTDKLLHGACQLFPNSTEIIRSALLSDADAIRRPERLTLVSNHSTSKRASQKGFNRVEPYTLPINIALRHKASLGVLKVLVDAGADTIESTDGRESSTSLIVALKTNPSSVSIIGLLLYSNNKCAMISDRKKNYPLHIACLRGSSLEVVHHLYQAYPTALSMKNFYGETPLDIAQRTSSCPEDVLSFLQSNTLRHCTVEDV